MEAENCFISVEDHSRHAFKLKDSNTATEAVKAMRIWHGKNNIAFYSDDAVKNAGQVLRWDRLEEDLFEDENTLIECLNVLIEDKSIDLIRKYFNQLCVIRKYLKFVRGKMKEDI